MAKQRPNKKVDNRGFNRKYAREGEDDVKRTVSERRSDQRDRVDKPKGLNDVSWYAKNNQMLIDAASFSYNSPLGLSLPYDKLFPGTDLTAAKAHFPSVPGIVSMKFTPCIGVSISSTSPANLAAQNIYSYVRYMNSGAKNYDQADIMLYLCAFDSIYMMWNWAKRIYGYARTYSQRNKYMPSSFAMCDGVDLQSIVENLSDYRYGLNSLAAQISSFCVPAVMPLFIRHSWMASNIYKDSDIDKAQMYMFTPHVYYVYNETSSSFGGVLEAKLVGQPGPGASGAKYSYDEVLALIKGMIDAVAYSEDIGVMSGDILKAYGQDKLFKLSPVEPEYAVEPVYNEEVLNQIHNSRVCPINETNLTTLNITQNPDSGYLIWNPTLVADTAAVDSVLINMPWNEVTPANTMVGTRLTAIQGEDNRFSSVGTEFISKRVLFTMLQDGGFYANQYGNYIIVDLTGEVQDITNSVSASLSIAAKVSQFDWHPLMMCAWKNNFGTMLQGYLGDVSNYTVISAFDMEQMNTTAILSEFNVPQIGSF